MPITRLYYSGSIETGQTLCLDKNASHHLIRVMRNRINAELLLFNGDSFEYPSTIVDDNVKNCLVQVNEKKLTHCESPQKIALLQGISRSDRMDACLQKSTELGVTSVIPVICNRTTTKLNANRAQKKQQHWQQVIISACEQSGRCVIPELKPIMSYSDALTTSTNDCKLVLSPDSSTGFKDIANPASGITILVGPEGGLTQDELKLAISTDYKEIRLGPRILRTETAGPACITAIQTLWGDLA